MYIYYGDDNQSRYIQTLSSIQNSFVLQSKFLHLFFSSLQGDMRKLTLHTDRGSLKLFIFHQEQDYTCLKAE